MPNQIDWDQQCYGCSENSLKKAMDNALGGKTMFAMSILSDAQHLISDEFNNGPVDQVNAENARQFINRAKYVIGAGKPARGSYLQQFDIESDAFDTLPRTCLAVTPSGEKVQIKRGHKGYYPIHKATDVDLFNDQRGITAYQVEAMLTGSLFGFHVPGADPANIEKWDNERKGKQA